MFRKHIVAVCIVHIVRKNLPAELTATPNKYLANEPFWSTGECPDALQFIKDNLATERNPTYVTNSA